MIGEIPKDTNQRLTTVGAVDGGGSGVLLGVHAGLVGGNLSSVSVSIGDVVHGAHSAVVVAEAVRAGHVTAFAEGNS